MSKFCHQLKLLLWKNFKLRLRHKVRCLIEIIWPLVLFLILMWVRTRGLKEGRASCHTIPKALPSVGGFEFFQNYLCSLNNTCHTRYVEEDQHVWRNASIIRLINQATPLLEGISSNNNTLSTFRLMWSNLKLFIKYISGLKSRADLLQLGSITADKLLTPEGKESFLESAPTYIGLDRKDLENALQTEINLQALSSTNLQELLQDFRTGECGPNKTYSVIKKNPPDETYKKLCSLGPQRAFLLLYIFTSFMDQKGVAGEIASDLALSNLDLLNSMSSISNSSYDSSVLQNVMKLGRLIADDPITNFSSLFNSSQPISGADTARFYALVCGSAGNNNRSMFGFENEGANRYDSLRDNLKDWRKEEIYEPDPDISPICNTIFMRFESSPLTSFFWKQIKPFVRGSIYYAPNTTFTREIMRKVDEKFSKIKDVENDVNILISILHRVRFWVRNNSEDIETLKEILSDPVVLKKALEFANVQLDPIQMKQLEGFIKWVRENDIEKFLERIDLIAEVLSELLNCMRYDKTKPFKTEEDAVKAALPLLPLDNLWAVVIFDNLPKDSNATNTTSSSNPPRLTTYKIRMDSDKVDSTKSFRDRVTRRFPRRRPIFDLKYVTSGFVYIQEFIEQSLIEMHTKKSLDGFNIYLQQFPFPCYIFDQFIRAVSRTFPLFMVLSWLYASAMIIKSIVLEKEKHIRETMKVMGLSNLCIWAGWFIDSFSIMAFSATILSVLLKWGRVIENSEFTLIWVFMISFTVSAICFSFLISTFFSRANSAAAAGGVLFFVTYLPYNWILIWEDHLEWFHILCGCLLSNVAFGFGCLTIAKAEEDGYGARWDRVSLSQSPEGDFNLSYCILMMWVDSVLYLILTLYFEAIMPGTGTPKKWYFLFQKSTWVSGKPKDAKKLQEEMHTALHHPDDDVRVEEEPEGLTCGISIHNLCKTYSNGKVALTNLNLNFYENQITSFLGHNGAGKTTAISILTGLFSPTSGTAYVYGKDIRKEINEIRKDLGICPQFNVLFDRLTVEEHMIFFAGLKGKYKIQKDEIDKMLVDLGIPEKRHEFPGNLSGGMKRKLCVAIAFVGGSKTVYLDEPTSGVDPHSRRKIWELLLKYKHGRTICLTTHYMDEAELLGDRIAIISQGKLKTSGSSLFLKTHFGQGYSLHLVKKEHLSRDNETLQNNLTTRKTTTEAENEALINIEPVNSIPNGKLESNKKLKSIIPSFIKFRVPEAILVDDIKTEMTFLLPYDSTSSFSKLLGDLDDNIDSLGISSYGISDASLEDIFLKITLEDLEETDSIKSGSRKRKLRGYCACCFNIGKKDENRVDDYSRIQGQKEKSIHEDKNESVHENNSPGEDTDETHVLNSTPESEVLLEEEHHDTDDETTVTFKSNKSNDHISNTKSSRHNNHSSGPELHSLLNEDQQEQQNNSDHHQIPVEEEEAISVKKKIKRNFCSLCWIQICAIILKRFRNSRSNLKAMFFEIILPAVFIALTLTFTLLFPKPGDEPPREITPFVYPSPTNIFFSEVKEIKNDKEKEAVEDFNRIINELTGPIGMGTPCLKQKLKEQVCDLDPKLWSNASVAKFDKKRRAFSKKDAKLGNCSCPHGSQKCDSNSKIENEPPKLATRTHDFIQDTTQYFLPEYLEKTYKKYDLHRYGGYEFQLRDPSNVNFTHFINLIDIITSLDKEPHTPEPNTVDKIKAIKIWYENRGWVSSVAYLNALHNMILRENLPESSIKDKSEFGITLIQHPLNLTESQESKENLKTSFMGVVHAVCIILALSFVPASFTVYLIEEKSNGGKHLHLVSGVKPITYWVANFIYDMYKYMIPAVLAVILFILFDAHAYVSEYSIWAFSLLLVLYGWSSIPLMYPATYIFRIPSTAFVTLACLNLFIGVITTLSTFVLEQFGDEELEQIGNILKKVFLIFPHYCLGRGLIELVALDIISTAQTSFKISHIEISRFDWERGLGKMHFSLLIQGFVFFFINLACDYRQHILRFTKRKPKYAKDDLNDEDEDVHRERERVLNDANISKTSVLAAENLTKFYKRKKLPSVNRLSFAIEQGECFGLLGVNGAGKTTTFKMLTGDVKISSGKAYICGFDVEKDRDFARKHFGYCPQEDSLDSLLNAYEMLELYGRLRGMGRKETREASEKLIKTLGLTRYAKRHCGTYSGGNKRKLNTAIALIGDPDIVFLDEPTSGMDPAARRLLWKVILQLIHTGKSVVLTSHSMEECEALCTRLGLMVNAQFVCFGSIQHLKNRFGKGYVLTIRLSGEEKRDEFLNVMEQNLPSATHTDSHFTQMKFSIPQESVKLREVFEVVYLAKNDNIIEDYSLSQTTLDDIFVQFAKHQRDELDR